MVRKLWPVDADETMDDNERDSTLEPITIARCRELLGDEALALSDEDVEAIRTHAHAVAHVLVEIFLTDEPRA